LLPDDDTCSMIQAITFASAYRRQRNPVFAAYWLQKGAMAAPQPRVQPSILIPPWVTVDTAGNLSLDWDHAGWSLTVSDSVRSSLRLDTAAGDGAQWLALAYDNDLRARDQVIYRWRGFLPAHYWPTLRVQARIHPGSFLTAEVLTENGRARFVSYAPGTGAWQTFAVPVQGSSIQEIALSLSEPAADAQTPRYQVDLAAVELQIDDSVRTCRP
jgi:hypothetical protein